MLVLGVASAGPAICANANVAARAACFNRIVSLPAAPRGACDRFCCSDLRRPAGRLPGEGASIFSKSTELGCQFAAVEKKMSQDELRSLLSDRSAAGTPESRIVRVMSERGTLSAAKIATITGMA